MKNTIFLMGGVSPWSYTNSLEYLMDELKKCDGGDVTVYIRSNGGSVFEGIDMHNALRAYAISNKSILTTVAMGIVASIALFVFLAGDERHAFDNSTLMGHNSSNFTWGDRHAHETSMNLLKGIDDVQARKFAKLQGVSLETIKENMTKEMWYIGEEQLEKSKLTTKILNTEEHLDIELPDGATAIISDPVKAQKDFLISFAKESLEHGSEFNTNHIEQSIQACKGNCPLSVNEDPTETMPSTEKLANIQPKVEQNNEGIEMAEKNEVTIESLQALIVEKNTTIEALQKDVDGGKGVLATAQEELATANASIEAAAVKADVMAHAVAMGMERGVPKDVVIEAMNAESKLQAGDVIADAVATGGATFVGEANGGVDAQAIADAKEVADSKEAARKYNESRGK